MNGQKQKFSELKKQAREAMAGRCGTLVGATAINLFLTFSCSLIPTLIFSGTTLYDIIFLNLTLFLFSLLLSLFQAGYLKICLSTLRREPISVGGCSVIRCHLVFLHVLIVIPLEQVGAAAADHVEKQERSIHADTDNDADGTARQTGFCRAAHASCAAA